MLPSNFDFVFLKLFLMFFHLPASRFIDLEEFHPVLAFACNEWHDPI